MLFLLCCCRTNDFLHLHKWFNSRILIHSHNTSLWLCRGNNAPLPSLIPAGCIRQQIIQIPSTSAIHTCPPSRRRVKLSHLNTRKRHQLLTRLCHLNAHTPKTEDPNCGPVHNFVSLWSRSYFCPTKKTLLIWLKSLRLFYQSLHSLFTLHQYFSLLQTYDWDFHSSHLSSIQQMRLRLTECDRF